MSRRLSRSALREDLDRTTVDRNKAVNECTTLKDELTRTSSENQKTIDKCLGLSTELESVVVERDDAKTAVRLRDNTVGELTRQCTELQAQAEKREVEMQGLKTSLEVATFAYACELVRISSTHRRALFGTACVSIL